VETAANLARAKNLQELKKINMVSIMDEVGQLPETHLHCAQLVPYSRESVTQFSPHALRGIKKKKSGGYYKIRMLK
jgi:hypothetical protein